MNVGSTAAASQAPQARQAPDSVAGALLRTAKETQELQGEAALKLVESAAVPPAGTGTMVNDVA